MHIIISNSSDKAIYEQITEQIKNLILNGELQPTEMLPSIRGLAKDLRISVITTKRAYEELEHEGYIETVAGKGSFVSNKNQVLLKEEMYQRVEQNLNYAIRNAKNSGIELGELIELLTYLYEEEHNE